MAQKTDIVLLYETLLSAPGMNELVKIDLKLTCKNILLLSKIIERGMQPKGEEKEGVSIMEIVPQEMLAELNGVAEELLRKAKLFEMNEKLNAFRQ